MTDTWRVMIVGHSPSLVSDEDVPLVSGRSGLTLAEAIGIPVRWFTYLFECRNLFPDVPNIRPTTGALLVAAQELRPRLAGRRAILLGRDVARAFMVHRSPVAQWTASPGSPPVEVAILPHPSPRNPWWDTRKGRSLGAGFLREEAAHAAAQALDKWPGPSSSWPPELVTIADYCGKT